MFDEYWDRSIERRLQRYVELSEQACQKADAMPTWELQQGYMRLADDWRALAASIERKAGQFPLRSNAK
jgi:hypothetical protein